MFSTILVRSFTRSLRTRLPVTCRRGSAARAAPAIRTCAAAVHRVSTTALLHMPQRRARSKLRKVALNVAIADRHRPTAAMSVSRQHHPKSRVRRDRFQRSATQRNVLFRYSIPGHIWSPPLHGVPRSHFERSYRGCMSRLR